MDTLLLEEIRPTTERMYKTLEMMGFQLPFPQLVCRISEPSTVSVIPSIPQTTNKPIESMNVWLVGGFNPFEKYARQNWIIFPRVQGEN